MYYGFFRGERACYYLGGYDPEFKSLSPGNLLVHHAIIEAVEEGATVFDFLRGDESYKYRWGAIDQPLFGRVLKRRM